MLTEEQINKTKEVYANVGKFSKGTLSKSTPEGVVRTLRELANALELDNLNGAKLFDGVGIILFSNSKEIDKAAAFAKNDCDLISLGSALMSISEKVNKMVSREVTQGMFEEILGKETVDRIKAEIASLKASKDANPDKV